MSAFNRASDAYKNEFAVILPTIVELHVPSPRKNVELFAVPVADSFAMLTAALLIFAVVTALLAIVRTPAFETDPSPDKLTAVANPVPFPTQIFPDANPGSSPPPKLPAIASHDAPLQKTTTLWSLS
jgi:hypothetical protein